MAAFLKKLIFSISILFITTANASQFTSEIFSYDDYVNAKGLHVTLNEDNWYAEDIKPDHLQLHINLFGNSTVMAGFADGQIRSAESVIARVKNSIEERFGKGSPHGLLTVLDEEKQPFMHVVAGGGDRPGTSELAYAMLPEYWGKKYGEKVVTKIVQEWAPAVYKIGRGIGLESNAHANIIKAFQCFDSKPLEQIDATASPSNIASWKILVKTGFEAAKCNLESTEIIIDYDHKEFESLTTMEAELLKLFDIAKSNTDQPLVPGKRYYMIDPEGQLRTISKHTKWERMKYHFEKKNLCQF
ncbi:hypothetical protein IM40_02530 [Candidatus Paracaedimonas acanthamoebae]|nr:hypothetical protein IM40_02530 [Candidatus Paracaedimonas acanthamoebae]